MRSIREKISDYYRNLDGIQGCSFEIDFSARIGKHYCPYCKGLLQLTKKEEIVNSESDGYKRFSNYIYGGGSGGNIQYVWEVYYCEACDKEMHTGVILDYERELKKTGGNVDFDEYQDRKNQPGWKKHDWRSLLLACALVAIISIVVIVLGRFSW